jgi:hypothetical protein
MKKYVFLFRGGLPTPEQEADQVQKMGPWVGSLTKGKAILGDPFLPFGKIVSGEMCEMVTDITMDNNSINGYFVIEAENYDEAVVMTKGCPGFEIGGSIEVREVNEMVRGPQNN